MVSIYVNRQADGSIDIMEIFRAFTPNQLEFCVSYLKKQPIFEDKNLDRKLIDDINEIIFQKKFSQQSEDIKEMTPEFKRMIMGVLDHLINHEKSSQ